MRCVTNSCCSSECGSEITQRWCSQNANDWYEKNGWVAGCNYIPSTAINQLEMWQHETFDPACIDKELSWANDLGFNTIRVFLHHLVWEQNSLGYIGRIDKFLSIAAKHNIKTMFVLFDSVWDPHPKLGKQPDARKNVHNSGWVQCPGVNILKDINAHDTLRSYVEGIIGNFKNDDRVLLWDLFNEPDNANGGSYKDGNYVRQKAELALQLLKKTFKWARTVKPQQPLTAAPWKDDWTNASVISALDNYMFANSDVISFHSYENKYDMEKRIKTLQLYNRPLICSEYMARHLGCTFEDVLPLLKKYNVGALNWGLVAGKTQTHCPWDSWETAYDNEPEIWFHDIFRSTGEPFDKHEVEYIKNLLKKPEILRYRKVA
jgi:hypothetical protein